MSNPGITIAAVGDTICRKRAGFSGDPFWRVHDLLSDTDITFANLETVLTEQTDSQANKLITIRTDPYSATHRLTSHGINVVNLANNHTLDYGAQGAIETQQHLMRRDIVSNGLVLSSSGGPSVIRANGLSVGFQAYHLYSICDETVCVAYYENRYHEVLKEVAASAELYDVIIVSLHWGVEHVSRPSPAQVRLAHGLIDAGASVILGHHPHCVQGIERYRDGLIVYSLGCFNFWMMGYLKDRWYHKLSYVLRLCVGPDGVSYFDRVPVWIDDTASPTPITDPSQHQWAQQYFQQLDNAVPPVGWDTVGAHRDRWQDWYEEVGPAYVPLVTKSFIKTILKFGPSRVRKLTWWLRQKHTRLAIAGLARAIIKRRGTPWPTPPKEFNWE